MSERCEHTETQYFGAGVYRCTECGEVIEPKAKLVFQPSADATAGDDELPEWVVDSYWTLRQMLDGPPEQHSAHSWAEFSSRLVRGYEELVRCFERVNAKRQELLAAPSDDSRRLDWLDEHRPFLRHVHKEGQWFVLRWGGCHYREGKTIRGVIDAARAAEE